MKIGNTKVDKVNLQIVLTRLNIVLERMNKFPIEIKQVSSNVKLNEICDLDSLSFMEFITAIEQEFNIEFRDDIEFDQLNNIETLIEEIEKELCFR